MGLGGPWIPLTLPLVRASEPRHQPGVLPKYIPTQTKPVLRVLGQGLEQDLTSTTSLLWLTGILPMDPVRGARAAASHMTENQPRSAGTSGVGFAVMESSAGKEGL